MFELFVRCPLLESLHLESKAAMGLRQPWTKDRQESSAHTLAPEEQERTKDDGSTSPLRLRSFVTRNACLVQSDLEQFLLLTPKLTTLRLINLKPRCDYYYTDVTYNWPQLRDHIRGIPMQLESFYYSDESSPWSVSEGINAALTVCPNTPTEWTLEIAKLRSPMIRSLQKLPNVVTVLDLTFHFAGSGQLHDEGLHAYLCSSPHLLHLRAPNTPLYLQQLDLHHRWNDRHSTLSASAAKLSPPGIWACRRLKTLEFHLCAYTDSSATEQSHQAPLRSRILFGYISRVCPDLRHLFIDTAAHTGSKKPAEHALSFLLKGGFCLLTQLTHLESLTVGAENRDIVCRTVDLAWMTPAGYGIRRRRERRTELQSWEDQLAAEQREETLKSRMKKKEAPGIAAATATGGNDLREALKDLGRLKEVKDLLVEMDGRECRCWPVLDKVAIYRANRVGRTKEAELERFFPSKLPTL
ncbi:hypothetical protein BGX29_009669 [Mortierella sp. GBA35]|nr:hypothetical protein BGX29_009669 [Mortierella sp. GBA35]